MKQSWNGVRSNPKGRHGQPRRASRLRELASQEFQKRNETNEIYIPPGERLATWYRGQGLSKAYGDACCSTP